MNKSSQPKQTIYLFTTSHSGLYLRDLLNVACFPDGWGVEFGYKSDHISAQIVANFADLHGSPAVIVYCEPLNDTDNDIYYFYHPIRQATIEYASKDESDGLTLGLCLGSIFDYSAGNHDKRLKDFQFAINSDGERPSEVDPIIRTTGLAAR